jgi:hypothetical protein
MILGLGEFVKRQLRVKVENARFDMLLGYAPRCEHAVTPGEYPSIESRGLYVWQRKSVGSK